MLRSMTGFGRGEAVFGEKKIAVEVRSINHRFLDVSVRLPKSLFALEREIKKLVASYTSRGKVDVTMQCDSLQGSGITFQVHTPAARHIYAALQQLQRDINLPGDITVLSLLTFKDLIFKEAEDSGNESSFWEACRPPLVQALESLQQMQTAEGTEIGRDIQQRLKEVAALAERIEARLPEALAARKQALQQRVQALCEGVEPDPARMLQEIALLADRCDVTEELVRAKSHLKQFGQWLNTQEPVGRKLDFLVQEINREVNTIGAKVADSDISLTVVEIKNEMEKIREQAQNVM